MTDEEVEKIIKQNMNLTMNLAGIRADFEAAQQRTWVGLTPEEMQQVFVANSVMVDNGNAYMVAGLRAINIGQAIEAKLKEKNEKSSKN